MRFVKSITIIMFTQNTFSHNMKFWRHFNVEILKNPYLAAL